MKAATWRPPSIWPWPWMSPVVWPLAVAFLVWNAFNLEVNPERIARGLSRLGMVAARAFPPDFHRAGLLASGVLESIEIATLSTIFGVLLGIPVAILAARKRGRTTFFLSSLEKGVRPLFPLTLIAARKTVRAGTSSRAARRRRAGRT